MSLVSKRAAEKSPDWLRLVVLLLSFPVMWGLYFVLMVYAAVRKVKEIALRG